MPSWYEGPPALRRRPAGGGAKPPRGALAEDCRAERRGKRRCKSRQAGTRKTNEGEPPLTCRKLDGRHQNRGVNAAPGQAWRVPVYWPGGVRHGGGVSLVCGVRAEQGKVLADTVRPVIQAGREGVR